MHRRPAPFGPAVTCMVRSWARIPRPTHATGRFAPPRLSGSRVRQVGCELRTRIYGLSVARSRAPPAGITSSPGRTPRCQRLCRPSLAARAVFYSVGSGVAAEAEPALGILGRDGGERRAELDVERI